MTILGLDSQPTEIIDAIAFEIDSKRFAITFTNVQDATHVWKLLAKDKSRAEHQILEIEPTSTFDQPDRPQELLPHVPCLLSLSPPPKFNSILDIINAPTVPSFHHDLFPEIKGEGKGLTGKHRAAERLLMQSLSNMTHLLSFKWFRLNAYLDARKEPKLEDGNGWSIRIYENHAFELGGLREFAYRIIPYTELPNENYHPPGEFFNLLRWKTC